MTVPTLVEPIPGGFRASTGGPLALTADGPTAEAALAVLKLRVDARLANGVVPTRPPIGLTPPARTTADIDQETWDGFLDAVREYRAQVDREDAERLAAEGAAGSAPR